MLDIFLILWVLYSISLTIMVILAVYFLVKAYIDRIKDIQRIDAIYRWYYYRIVHDYLKYMRKSMRGDIHATKK